jgi:NADPH:quinone reductase-like Zn-dependent oxidoreductase
MSHQPFRSSWLPGRRALRGPEVLDVVDLPDPVPGDDQQLYEVSAAGVNFANTHHRLSTN